MKEEVVWKILDLTMTNNGAGAATIREYLKALLHQLWIEDESFSGKRPFGNSGWQYEVYTALVTHGAVDGALDEDGYIDEVNTTEADEKILQAILSL